MTFPLFPDTPEGAFALGGEYGREGSSTTAPRAASTPLDEVSALVKYRPHDVLRRVPERAPDCAEGAPRLILIGRCGEGGPEHALDFVHEIRLTRDLRVLIELHLSHAFEAPVGLGNREVLALLHELDKPGLG